MPTPPRLRLRTQLLVAMLALAFVLTSGALLVVRHSIRSEVRAQSSQGLAAAVRTFQHVQEQQAAELSRTAALVAELPTLKALMTTDDARTIQDGSGVFSTLAGGDAFLLTSADGSVKAVHSTTSQINPVVAAAIASRVLSGQTSPSWWHDGSALYEFVQQPIVAGSGVDKRVLGALLLGRRMNAAVQELGRASGSEVVLVAGNDVVATTLSDGARPALATLLQHPGDASFTFDGRSFQVASVALETRSDAPIRCYVLFPLDAAEALIGRMNRTITVLGIIGVIVSLLLASVIARAITRPVENLVGAARALASGDYHYSLGVGGTTEVADLGAAFTTMRDELSESQRKQLEDERLAALGRAASSISHDLRHHLAALVANAEFLREAETLGFNRDEIYAEIERASAQMTDLIDSLVELARDRHTIVPAPSNLESVVRKAVSDVRGSPEFRGRVIDVTAVGGSDGCFDARKMERAIYNLVLNACEASAATADGRVAVIVAGDGGMLECRVWDNGSGIPAAVRDTLFEPFVSAGKNNGTGLGLAIASKIVHDHDGTIAVEQTSNAGTTFVLRFPRRSPAQNHASAVDQSA